MQYKKDVCIIFLYTRQQEKQILGRDYSFGDGEFKKRRGFIGRDMEGCGDLAPGRGSVETAQEIIVRFNEGFGENLASPGVNDRKRAARGEAFDETSQVDFPGLEQVEDLIIEPCQPCTGGKNKVSVQEVCLFQLAVGGELRRGSQKGRGVMPVVVDLVQGRRQKLAESLPGV